jgi:putative tryptophan/tyrosine transport system substrate-binding protein
MRRRDFISLIGTAAATWPLAAGAQQREQVRRIGVMAPYPEDDKDAQIRNAAFLQGLQESGWTEGRNMRIDYRWGTGDADRNRRNATELVALAPDVILAVGTLLGALAESDPQGSDCVRARPRSSRCRLCQ